LQEINAFVIGTSIMGILPDIANDLNFS